MLDAFDLTRRFSEVVCEDDFPFRKPDPRTILHLVERLGVTPETTLMVGDGPQDVRAARNAGTLSCAVPQGYGRREEVLALRPTWVIDTIAELPALLDRIDGASPA